MGLMATLTGLLYGALVVYLGGWFFGHWIGNFSLLLFVLTVVTLAYWLAERLRFKPAREAAAGLFVSGADLTTPSSFHSHPPRGASAPWGGPTELT